jgi:peptidoglycan/xylan/chitin deacetylase (PgdA/CDA1 family)
VKTAIRRATTLAVAAVATASIGLPLIALSSPAQAATNAGTTVQPLNNDCSAGSVEFTFDDGPDPTTTPQILSMLDSLNVKATFFVIGNRIDNNPSGEALVQQEYADGMVIGNHTYDHQSFTGASTGTAHLTQAQILNELDSTSNVLTGLGIPAPTLYRPPYGDLDGWSDNIARADGYKVVEAIQIQTNTGARIIDSLDWTGISSSQIASDVINGYTTNGWFHPGITAGAVLAFHDTAPATVDALPLIVNYMNANHLCATTTMPTDTTGGVVATPAPPEPTTGNLVQNPSLETMHVSGGVTTNVPDCFQQGGNNTASNTAQWTTLTDPTLAHSGNVAEQVQVTQWTAGDRKLVVDQQASHASCLAQLNPGQSVRVWTWYRGSWAGYGASTDPTKVTLALYYRDSSSVWHYWVGSPVYPPSSTWNLASMQSPPLPAGATAVSYGMAIQGVGTLVTDDYAMAVS